MPKTLGNDFCKSLQPREGEEFDTIGEKKRFFLKRGVEVTFEEEYRTFIELHKLGRTGENQRRLEQGHGNAEKLFLKNIWWPLFRDFENLYPEYEVDEFRDGNRYLDFAYIRTGLRLCIEIDGFGPHLKKISRWQFSDQLFRQNQLVIDGWIVLRFSYDDVDERPRRCQQMIQQILGKYMENHRLDECSLSSVEKEIIRLAVKQNGVVKPREVGEYLQKHERTARRILKGLVSKKVLIPASGV